MKKLALLFICALTFTGCEIEDDGPQFVQTYAEVIDAELPESFEEGKTYEITITYLLPTACHTGEGVRISRGATLGDERRDIYVAGVVSRDANLTDCTEEGEDLEKEVSFQLTIDEDEPFTFYLWTGVDIDNKSTYTTIEVPVTAPDSSEEEE